MRSDENRLSRPIVWIATGAIAVGIALMIISIAVLQGFQNEIREKVVGFGAHVQVVATNKDNAAESERVLAKQEFLSDLKDMPEVRHVQQFSLKPAILETRENLQGVLLKGIASDYDPSFFADRIVAGEMVSVDQKAEEKQMIVSSWLANRMELEVGDRARVYVVQHTIDIQPRTFEICGIYETGLKEFDRQYVFVDQIHVARASGWGLEAQIRVNVDTALNAVTLEGLGFGGDGEYRYIWDREDWHPGSLQVVDPCDANTYRMVLKDRMLTVQDTAWVTIHPGPDSSCCTCGLEYVLDTSGGSYDAYCGGFEVMLSDYKKIWEQDDAIYMKIDKLNFQTQNVLGQNRELFNWLESLDVNVIVIIVLVIFISVINMTSALLIIILEKTRMIGMLKALGISDRSVVEIFLQNAAYIIGRGMLIGNVLGAGLCFAQMKWSFLKLDPTKYFVDRVPILLDGPILLGLNAGTLLVCMLFLLLPALYVTKITPVRAIRFD